MFHAAHPVRQYSYMSFALYSEEEEERILTVLDIFNLYLYLFCLTLPTGIKRKITLPLSFRTANRCS